MSENARRKWYKHCPNIPNDRRAGCWIHTTPVIQIDTDNPTLLLKGNFRLPAHVFIFVPRVLPNEHHIGTSTVYALTTPSLNVRFVLGVNLILQLAISKIKINVLMGLPCTHEMIVANIGTAKTNKCPW